MTKHNLIVLIDLLCPTSQWIPSNTAPSPSMHPTWLSNILSKLSILLPSGWSEKTTVAKNDVVPFCTSLALVNPTKYITCRNISSKHNTELHHHVPYLKGAVVYMYIRRSINKHRFPITETTAHDKRGYFTLHHWTN